MKKKVALLACVAVMAGLITVAEADKKKDQTVKCVVAGKEIKISAAQVVSYKDANVYVCCKNCKGKFEQDATKFSAKANHQLVATMQAKQEKCPLAGRPVNDKMKVKVAGVEVGFCCGGCKGKASKATGDEQLELVFNDKSFAKGFVIAKKKK